MCVSRRTGDTPALNAAFRGSPLRCAAGTAVVGIAALSTALVLLLTAFTRLAAQEGSFTASASKTTVSLGEQFQVTFTLSGGSLKSHSDFRQPNLNAQFLTLAGPSTSQSMQWINGKVSSSISWTYVLQPRSAGSFTIPPASLNYDGAVLKSNSLTIKVTASAPGGGQAQKPREEEGRVDLGDNLFVRAHIDKRSAWVGEPIFVTYKVYSRVAFRVDNISKVPRMVGFWSEDIDMPAQIRPEIEVLDGKQYESYTLKKVVYFPTQSGELNIDPFEINCTVQVRQKRRSGDDFFDRFFNDPFFDSYKNVQKTLLTDRIKVTVRPLPESGKPESFAGAVGSFTMKAALDKTRLKVNESATLTVAVNGSGNIKLLDAPLIEYPNGLEHYDPTINEDIKREGARISGVKTFEYLLIPRYAGEMELPPVEFSWFEPESGQYRTVKSESWVLTVLEDDSPPSADSRGPLQRVRDIHGLAAWDGSPSSNDVPGAFSLLFAAPVLLSLGALAYKKRQDRLRGDVMGMRMRRATRLAEKHLALSKRHLRSGNTDAYYLEIARALWGYVQNKLSLHTAETSLELVESSLRSRELPEDTVAAVRSALDAVDEARFSPARATETAMRSLYGTARSAIITLEQALRA